MALPILDGNQSATTLSTILSGGEHTPAHTVVSLGSQAITDITSAVSGSVVSVSNFPSTQTIAGTVTANSAEAVSIINSTTITKADAKFSLIAGANNPADVASSYSITPLDVDIKGVAFVDGKVVSHRSSCVAELTGQGGPAWKATLVASSVTVGNSVTIGSLPAISGTVTANGGDFVGVDGQPTPPLNSVQLGYYSSDANSYLGIGDYSGLPVRAIEGSVISGTVTVGNAVTISNTNFQIKAVTVNDGGAILIAPNGASYRLFPPSGATVNLNNIFGATPTWITAFTDSITFYADNGTNVAYFHDGAQWVLDDFTTPAGTVALSGTKFVTNLSAVSTINLSNGFTATQTDSPLVEQGAIKVSLTGSSVTIGAMPNGSLTTRFGTPTTASVAFATTAVTNANRKYLLIQNVTTGSNVITIGIGFTPTTTQGIQLTAGAGITFESSYIPTGAVYVLSSVTASNFTILEA
jgi:hypothetical protein